MSSSAKRPSSSATAASARPMSPSALRSASASAPAPSINPLAASASTSRPTGRSSSMRVPGSSSAAVTIDKLTQENQSLKRRLVHYANTLEQFSNHAKREIASSNRARDSAIAAAADNAALRQSLSEVTVSKDRSEQTVRQLHTQLSERNTNLTRLTDETNRLRARLSDAESDRVGLRDARDAHAAAERRAIAAEAESRARGERVHALESRIKDANDRVIAAEKLSREFADAARGKDEVVQRAERAQREIVTATQRDAHARAQIIRMKEDLSRFETETKSMREIADERGRSLAAAEERVRLSERDVRVMEERMKEMESKADETVAALRKELDETNRQLAERSAQLVESSKQTARQVQAASQDVIEERDHLRISVRDLQEELEQSSEMLTRAAIDALADKGKIRKLEDGLAKARDELGNERRERVTRDSKIAALVEEVRAYEQELDTLKQTKRSLTDEIHSAQLALHDKEKTIANKSKQVEEIETERKSRAFHAESLSTALSNAKNALAKKENDHINLTDEYNELSEQLKLVSHRSEKLEVDHGATRRELSRVNDSLAQVTQERDRLKGSTEELVSARHQIAELTSNNAEKDEEIGLLNSKYNGLKIEAAESVREKKRISDALSEVTADLQRSNHELDLLRGFKKDQDALADRLNAVSEQSTRELTVMKQVQTEQAERLARNTVDEYERRLTAIQSNAKDDIANTVADQLRHDIMPHLIRVVDSKARNMVHALARHVESFSLDDAPMSATDATTDMHHHSRQPPESASNLRQYNRSTYYPQHHRGVGGGGSNKLGTDSFVDPDDDRHHDMGIDLSLDGLGSSSRAHLDHDKDLRLHDDVADVDDSTRREAGHDVVDDDDEHGSLLRSATNVATASGSTTSRAAAGIPSSTAPSGSDSAGRGRMSSAESPWASVLDASRIESVESPRDGRIHALDVDADDPAISVPSRTETPTEGRSEIVEDDRAERASRAVNLQSAGEREEEEEEEEKEGEEEKEEQVKDDVIGAGNGLERNESTGAAEAAAAAEALFGPRKGDLFDEVSAHVERDEGNDKGEGEEEDDDEKDGSGEASGSAASRGGVETQDRAADEEFVEELDITENVGDGSDDDDVQGMGIDPRQLMQEGVFQAIVEDLVAEEQMEEDDDEEEDDDDDDEDDELEGEYRGSYIPVEEEDEEDEDARLSRMEDMAKYDDAEEDAGAAEDEGEQVKQDEHEGDTMPEGVRSVAAQDGDDEDMDEDEDERADKDIGASVPMTRGLELDDTGALAVQTDEHEDVDEEEKEVIDSSVPPADDEVLAEAEKEEDDNDDEHQEGEESQEPVAEEHGPVAGAGSAFSSLLARLGVGGRGEDQAEGEEDDDVDDDDDVQGIERTENTAQGNPVALPETLYESSSSSLPSQSQPHAGNTDNIGIPSSHDLSHGPMATNTNTTTSSLFMPSTNAQQEQVEEEHGVGEIEEVEDYRYGGAGVGVDEETADDDDEDDDYNDDDDEVGDPGDDDDYEVGDHDVEDEKERLANVERYVAQLHEAGALHSAAGPSYVRPTAAAPTITTTTTGAENDDNDGIEGSNMGVTRVQAEHAPIEGDPVDDDDDDEGEKETTGRIGGPSGSGNGSGNGAGVVYRHEVPFGTGAGHEDGQEVLDAELMETNKDGAPIHSGSTGASHA